MTTSIRVSRRFARISNSDLITFGRNSVTQMTGNPVYPNPCVPLATMTTSLDRCSEAIEAALNGGKLEIAMRDQEIATLIGLLRQQAAYVEAVAADDLTKLLSSGFEAVSTNRAQIELPKPNILRLENSASAQLALRVEPVPTAKAYEVRMSYGPNGWQAVGVFTQARRIVVADLTPGTTYTFQVRAIGGSTGSSEWSDPMSHMSL